MSKFRVWLNVIGGLVFASLAGYGAYTEFFGEKSGRSHQGSMESSVDAKSPQENVLEQTLHVGKSTKQQYRAFLDMGGLDVERHWLGYHARELVAMHDESGVLRAADVTLVKNWDGYTLASFNNLRASLRDVCGDTWVDQPSSADFRMATGPSGTTCGVKEKGLFVLVSFKKS